MDTGSAANGMASGGDKFALLHDTAGMEVRAVEGGVEAVFAKQVHVGLGAVSLVGRVRDQLDLARHGCCAGFSWLQR